MDIDLSTLSQSKLSYCAYNHKGSHASKKDMTTITMDAIKPAAIHE